MKKITLLAGIFLAGISFAQTTVSFEKSENFNVGIFGGQDEDNWLVLEDDEGYLPNFLITEEEASHGTQSLKIATHPEYGELWAANMAVYYFLENNLEPEDAVFSTDFQMSDAEDTFYEIEGYAYYEFTNDEGEEDYEMETAFWFGMLGGDIYAQLKIIDFGDGEDKRLEKLKQHRKLKTMNRDEEPEDSLFEIIGQYEANKWLNFKTMATDGKLNYYLGGNLVKTVENILTKRDWTLVKLGHNNAGGTAFIDNAKHGTFAQLGIFEKNFSAAKISVYPNPATDFISVKTEEVIKLYKIYSADGRKVLEGAKPTGRISVESLAKGSYIFTAKTAGGKMISSKFIKK
ncbi:T9SS type A sorting domain-containing protein [Cruoricaptor ignavus]|uniref:T9SS type A sorting domain-containing protein n=1 Tax=Cruoricaptor ignavus TaxID=1118202 RepID=UPI00370D2D6D